MIYKFICIFCKLELFLFKMEDIYNNITKFMALHITHIHIIHIIYETETQKMYNLWWNA